jgi:radical SAM protein with 4Fe4S-binding SPASM domain
LDESLAICDQFPSLLVEEVDFTGGEPLLRSDWPKIVDHLGKLDIDTKILTNGLTLGYDTIAQMKDVGISCVGVSLDGLETIHDYIRGHRGLFRCILDGIEGILSAGIALTVITTVNGLNFNELPSLFALLRSIGVSRWQIQPIFPLGRVDEAAELELRPETYMQLGAFIQRWEPEAEKAGLEVLPSDSFGYFTEFDIRNPPWGGCGAGLVGCGITSDGRIKGCLSLPDEVIEGDLRENDMWDIWFHPDSFAYTRKFSIEKLGPSCCSCDKVEQCHGGCSTMSYASTGRFHNDPYCFYGIKKRSS